MKVWVTKYALTTGIDEHEAEQNLDISESMITVRGERFSMHFHGNDWHKTREAAVARANQMVQAKIKSLKKSIAKYEAMKFE